MTEPKVEHAKRGPPLDSALARLPALDALLRAEGLAHSPDRWLNLQDLLVRMAREGRLPGEPADLRRHMAPLFFRSPVEQARFGEVVDRWLAGVPVQEQEREREAAPRKDDEIPRTPYWPFGLAALILVAFVWWSLKPESKSEAEYPQETPVEEPAPSPGPLPGDNAWKTLPLQPLPPRTPLEEPVLDARHRAWLAAGDYTAPWVAAVLAVFGLAWRWVRRKVVPRGRCGDPRDPLASIPVAGVDEGLFGGSDVRTALRRLHTPVRWPTRRLAPVYQQRPEVPDLVLLVNFRHRADHMAGLGDLVEERLREAGLLVHRYDFQNEPRLARGSEAGAWLGLEELAARHPGSRLLVAGDAAALLDAWSGSLLPWAEAFAAWPDRGLLHTRPPAKAWRDVLEESGFALAPLSSAGLVSLGSCLSQVPPAPAPARGVGLPDLLAEREPWLSDTPPPAPMQVELLRDLRDYLGGPGMLLLAAMAGYPALHWGLTRALDLSLFPSGRSGASGRERRLLRLAALPWCRTGRMPDWLREILLRGLSPVQTERVAALYRALFRDQSLCRRPCAPAGSACSRASVRGGGGSDGTFGTCLPWHRPRAWWRTASSPTCCSAGGAVCWTSSFPRSSHAACRACAGPPSCGRSSRPDSSPWPGAGSSSAPGRRGGGPRRGRPCWLPSALSTAPTGCRSSIPRKPPPWPRPCARPCAGTASRPWSRCPGP